MKKLTKPQKPLHRTWIRLLPYAGFGAMLISLSSAESLQSTWIIYVMLMFAQLGIIGIYLLINKLADKKEIDKLDNIPSKI
ncbi:MAG: hypothetical protein QNJ41_24810 [Xenococcaceae cyanobacterium MO_188.B32]|nr:hypothetical protein [Xenococcaceae cyanobacterium MO_188.B32]